MWDKATILQFYHTALPTLFFFYIIALQIDSMARKIIGYYNDAQVGAEPGQLILEIGNDHLACLVKGDQSQQIESFEMFDLEKNTSDDWSDIFYEVKSGSQILNGAYRNTQCYYNFEEALVIPEPTFSATAAEEYLSLIYGESSRYEIKYNSLFAGSKMINAFRVRKSIHELVGRHFILYKPQHTYASILDDILTREELDEHFVKVQFYSTHIIIAVIKQKQLQLIQSFQYTTPEDVLYHLVNCIQQFSLNESHSHLEISGLFQPGGPLHKQLQSLFGLITFDGIKADGVFKSVSDYPSHHFTPFYKLVV